MKYIVGLFVLLFISESFFAQRDEAIRDTSVAGKLFHVIMYNETNHVACVGSYMPKTFIRAGEWDYFYADGKVYSKTFFKADIKSGTWIYYDEKGNIIKEEIYRSRLKIADITPRFAYRYGRYQQVNSHVDFKSVTVAKYIHYNEFGNIIKQHREKRFFSDINIEPISSVFYESVPRIFTGYYSLHNTFNNSYHHMYSYHHHK